MFEIIGIAVVVWFLWHAVKAVTKGAARGTLRRACDYAATLGVPHQIATDLSNNTDLIRLVRTDISKRDANFAALDVYEQWGRAIAAIYHERHDASTIGEDTTNKVSSFLQPQIRALESEGTALHINHITLAYLKSLATRFSGRAPNLEDVRDLASKIFWQEEHGFFVQNGYNTARRSSEMPEIQSEVQQIANEEVDAGEGQFFARYTRWARDEMENLDLSDDYDPSHVKRTSLLDI